MPLLTSIIFKHEFLTCVIRNLDLELELSELKNLVSRMEGNSAALDLESSKIDNLTRAELNRTMTEWSSRLQSLLDNERGKQRGDGGTLTPEQSKLRVRSQCEYS